MTQRLNYHALAPKSAQSLFAFSAAAAPSLDKRLLELIYLRVSQINGCGFCLDMHATALLKLGTDPRHLHVLAGWRETPAFFSGGERAALAWAEAVNALPHRRPTDQEFEDVRAHHEDDQIAEMTFAICAIRAWDMLNVSFRRPIPETPFVV